VGEFGVVLMIGGDIPGRTRTLSIAIFDQVQEMNYKAANATALWLVALSFVALLLVYGRGAAERRSELG
jgi:molybdate transport system permease protein